MLNLRAARDRLVQEHKCSDASDVCDYCLQPMPCDVRLMLDTLQGYEDGMTWMTTCTHCASLWNDNYAQYEQIEALTRQMKRLGIKPDKP